MTTQYFTGLSSPEEIKATYRRLAMKHHPDRGGDTETMQAINAQYQAALRGVHGHESQGSDGKQHTYYYNAEAEAEVMNKVQEIISTGMMNVEIMLIGSWIWVSGDTKPYRKILGKTGLGMRWHGKRSAWYWHTPQKRSRYNSRASLSDIAASYGYQAFQSDERDALRA